MNSKVQLECFSFDMLDPFEMELLGLAKYKFGFKIADLCNSTGPQLNNIQQFSKDDFERLIDQSSKKVIAWISTDGNVSIEEKDRLHVCFFTNGTKILEIAMPCEDFRDILLSRVIKYIFRCEDNGVKSQKRTISKDRVTPLFSERGSLND